MVKNSGGCKTKGMARKLVNAPVSNKIRFAEDDDECYAKVVKMLGNGMCHVNLLQKEVLHENVVCHIRGKFRSRNKKANFVSSGGTVLVGLRSWTSKVDACDLLCVYTDIQIPALNLQNTPLIQSSSSSSSYDDISFDNQANSINQNIHQNIDSTINHNIDSTINHNIDFNDI